MSNDLPPTGDVGGPPDDPHGRPSYGAPQPPLMPPPGPSPEYLTQGGGAPLRPRRASRPSAPVVGSR